MSEDRDTEQVSSTWLAQLRHEHEVFGGECARLQKDLDSCRRMFENAVMTIVTIGEAAGVRGEDQQNGHLEIVEAINKIKGRRAVYKAKATELERELEVWRSGPVCWSCGDSGEVHSLDGEWRGECNCQGAVDARRIAGLEADRDRIKTIADNYSALNMDAQAELAALKAQGVVMPDVNAAAKALCNRHAMICGVDADDQWKEYSQDFIADAETVLANARLNASPAAPAADAGLVEALEHARLFIVNGIDLGFIQMPEAGTPDPAHETLPMIDAALAAHRAKGVA